jgi:ABC-type phosphate transport system substrate-binding protein
MEMSTMCHAESRNRMLRGRRRGRRFLGYLSIVVLVILGAMAGQAAAEPFVVIVNADNPATGVTASELSNLFLKKASQWNGGLTALPVDLSESSPVRESFSRQVHHKGTAAVKAYWQQQIFSGRNVPPPEKGSIRDVVEFVRANRGAVGYVPSGTDLPSGVKVLDVRP